VVFGLLGLVAVSKTVLIKTLLRAVRLNFRIAIAAGIVGYFYGRFFLAKTGVKWYLPNNLQQPADFITVGSIHNFGYCGGIIGLLSGVVYILRHRGTPKLNSATSPSF
jgi:xanthine/uracil/vitamin C permease (AzgA family)